MDDANNSDDDATRIPLQCSAVGDDDDVAALPSSPKAARADGTVDIPFVAPPRALAIQAKRALLVRNALVASNVTACASATLVRIVQDHVRDGGKQVEVDEFMEMLRLLPEIRGREAFHPLEGALERIYRSFRAGDKLDLVQLGVGSLVLVGGNPKDKITAAVQLLSDSGDHEAENAKTTTMTSALHCLLLAVSALFDEEDADAVDVRDTASILAQSAVETVHRMWIANGLQDDDDINVTAAWEWIEERLPKSLAWVKLLDHSKWPVMQRLTPSPTKHRQDSAQDHTGDAEPPISAASTTGDGPPALNFRFSGVDGGILTIGEAEAEVLFNLLAQSAFTKVHAQTMYDTFVQHTGDGLLEEETFVEAIEELVSMTNATELMEDSDFLDTMLTIFRCFLPENCAKVDAFEVAAGFSLFAWGSKSDKLASSFHYFDVDSKGFLNRQQLWRFLRSVLITLLFLSPPDENIVKRYGSIADLVDTGEQELMENIMDDLDEDCDEEGGPASDPRLVYTFEEFGEWYNGGGFRGMSWLELLDLRKWVFVSPSFHLDELDVVPVDPVVASTNYFTAQNIQVDVDAGNSGGDANGHGITFPHAIEEEDDEDGDQDTGRNGGFPNSHSSYSSASTGPPHTGSINSTMPAILLKNEVVLEFDLAFDTEDDSTVEIPLSTLSFDNGDLIQYFELQRVVRLHEIELFQLFDVFEPHMEGGSTAWMEKSAYDECIKQLLPPEIALEVTSSFGVNPNTRVPPPSIGRSKDYKMIADMLSRLFFAFNRGGTGKIDLVEFVSAFTLFCAGSKSEKLAFAYRLFDSDRDGALTRREMWKYLRSFLTMLLALGNGAELSAEAIASVADATAIAIADAIFKDTNKTFSVRHAPSFARQSHRFSLDTPESADTVVASRNEQLRRGQYYHRGSLPNVNTLSVEGGGVSGAGPGAGSAFARGGVVSFEEFAQWYGTNGYNIIAWIELLDAKKWPRVSDEVASAILRYLSRQHRAIAEAALRGSGVGPGSGSTYASSTSSGSHREGRSSSLEGETSPTRMTQLNTADLLTADGQQHGYNSSMPTVADLIATPASGTASTRDLSSVALQFKLTSFDNTALRIRLKDVAIVYTIAERMGLRGLACEALLNKFNLMASGRCLTKIGYLRAMRDLVPREELTNEDQEFLSFHLLRIFALFEAESVLEESEDGETEAQNNGVDDDDTNGDLRRTSSVEKLQLVAGMSIFCDGSKSAKLGVLFKLFDTRGDGFVSRRHMFELLKSILVVLFAFSSFNANKAHTNDTSVNTWSTNSAAERTAGAIISKLFCEARCRQADAITLAEFATWYANGGYIDCPWLELLDLTKWPAKEAFEASKKEKPLIYAFDMLEEGNLLHFTESDIATYLFMLRSTRLSEVSVSKLYDALLAYATPSAEEALKMSRANQNPNQSYSYAAVEEDEGAYLVLSRSNFYECIRSLVPKDDMSEKAQQTSSKLLSRLFNVFDRKRVGRVNALELACGLSILGKGSKSQKLSMAFEFITKMRQQRHRSLSNYGVASMAGFNAGAGAGGFGGVNSVSTGGAFAWLTSARGAASTSTGLRRSALQNEANALPHSVLFIYLRSFLLALMALSEGTYRLGLEKMYAEADDFIEEAMGDLMAEVAANGNNAIGGGGYAGYGTARSRARVTFEQFGEWYNSGGFDIISWVELLDVDKWEQQRDSKEHAAVLTRTASGAYKSARMGSQRRVTSTRLVEPVRTTNAVRTTQKKQIRQSDINSSTYHSIRSRGRKQVQPMSTHRESTGAISLSSDGPIMVFAIHKDAAELQFFNDDLTRLKVFLRETRLHEQSPRQVSNAMLRALDVTGETGLFEVSRHEFVTAVENICSQRVGSTIEVLGDEAVDLIDSVLDVFIKLPPISTGGIPPGGEDEEDISNDPLDAGLAICGLFVVCGGSLLDKLKIAAQLFDESLVDHGIETTIDTLKTCLTCMLMAFYGMSCSLSGEVVRYSAMLGADEVIRDFVGSSNSDEDAASASKQEAPSSLDLDEAVSLKDFAEWFSDSGYHSHPWLELTELEHWPAAIDICDALHTSSAT